MKNKRLCGAQVFIVFCMSINAPSAANQDELLTQQQINSKLISVWAEKEATLFMFEKCSEGSSENIQDIDDIKNRWLSDNKLSITKTDAYLKLLLQDSIKAMREFASTDAAIQNNRENMRNGQNSKFSLLERLRLKNGCRNTLNKLTAPTSDFATDFKENEAILDSAFKNFCVLCSAAKQGNVDSIKALIAQGVAPNTMDYDHNTALYHSVNTGSFESVKVLLEAGADPTKRNDRGGDHSVLVTAALRAKNDPDKAKIISKLLQYKIDVNHQDGNSKSSALMMLAGQGDTRSAKILLAAGAKVDLRASNQKTALIVATSRNQTDSVSLLLEAGANPNSSDENGQTPLHAAAFSNNSGLVKILLEAGANPNAKLNSMTPLMMALGQPENISSTVNLLLAASGGKNVKYDDELALIVVLAVSNLTTELKALLNAGADADFTVSEGGETALMIAASQGLADVVKILLNNGANIEASNSDGVKVWDLVDGNKDVLKILNQFKKS